MTRSFYFPILLLISTSLPAAAQVTAGVSTGLVIGQKSVHLPAFAPQFGDWEERFDSIDFNGDGKFDALFEARAYQVFDLTGSGTAIQPLHPGFMVIADANGWVRALPAGDPVDAAQSWYQFPQYPSPFISRGYGFTGQLQEYGYWNTISQAYAGFRLVTATQDTLYGWMHVTATANANFPGAMVQVTQWAIEKKTSTNQSVDFIIAGQTGGLVPGNKTFTLEQGPVPFGGSAGKVDSLDLDRDGKHDVAFNAVICNTFDCVQSSTLCIGMHEGFTFVMGPEHARNRESGDTIFANANWNTVSTPNKVGLFAQLGLGFGGYQSEGEWLNDNYGYLAFRLVTPTDTLLGWIHLYTYSQAEFGAYLEVLGWAIQPDVSHEPYAWISVTPSKDVHCPGDTVVFQGVAFEADQFAWHFWDGTTDSAAITSRVLPDSTVTAVFEASNDNGTTTLSQVLTVSPLTLTAPDITLDCNHPSVQLSASTNIPAELCWIVGPDTTCNAFPIADSPGPFFVTARDQYGCTATGQVDVFLDINAAAVVIQFDEAQHLLIAQSFTPGVTFVWTSPAWPGPVPGDSVAVSASGDYTVQATAPNGCTSIQTISVLLTDVQEPHADAVRLQPNPAHDFLQVEHRLGEAWEYRIFDATGRLSLLSGQAPAGHTARLDLTALPAGLYWLAGYDTGGKRLFFKKFVKL